jgi:hypothetical protein
MGGRFARYWARRDLVWTTRGQFLPFVVHLLALGAALADPPPPHRSR